ncbi:MAG: RNA polymerase sigma-70 factor, ECF subfamily [Parcubacteria group bacterium Gr01-1014_46]|nr:MAG: RNA polymerase sigma-70 factor, ECF subfamily [Parcubacteria group bacterium Gr01-1014_46]
MGLVPIFVYTCNKWYNIASMNREKMQQDFLRAYDDNSDALFRQCFFKVHDRELAKDILQDTFVRTWDYIGKGNTILNMRAFLYRTMNNLVIDQYRKKKAVSLDSLEEDGFSPEAPEGISANDRLEGERALQLLEKLPDVYREAVFMRFVSGLELHEIAEITGETENTVSVHVHRGINKLRELFKLE